MFFILIFLHKFNHTQSTLVWAALWNFQGQARAGWELSILSWMVLFRPLRLLQRLDEPLSVLVHKVCLCIKIDRGSSSLCSSLRGLNSTIQLRIDSYKSAQACPWKFHNAVYTISDQSCFCSYCVFMLQSNLYNLKITLIIIFESKHAKNKSPKIYTVPVTLFGEQHCDLQSSSWDQESYLTPTCNQLL